MYSVSEVAVQRVQIIFRHAPMTINLVDMIKQQRLKSNSASMSR
jgi:hypothetical protein